MDFKPRKLAGVVSAGLVYCSDTVNCRGAMSFPWWFVHTSLQVPAPKSLDHSLRPHAKPEGQVQGLGVLRPYRATQASRQPQRFKACLAKDGSLRGSGTIIAQLVLRTRLSHIVVAMWSYNVPQPS